MRRRDGEDSWEGIGIMRMMRRVCFLALALLAREKMGKMTHGRSGPAKQNISARLPCYAARATCLLCYYDLQ